ncbi:hypothetical protein R3P38DRAFT_3026325 [Favolaschia claudopus]|uniref:Uncharacterized protein n=1 Tax=Favolaschia claudopus TaxID=2862362 RepID=A0AAW0AG52_9AGAR
MRSSGCLGALALSCVAVQAMLTNFTLDDTAPSIVYTEAPILRCSPDDGECSTDFTSQLFNGTSTITDGTIVIPFTGSAMFVYLSTLGDCIFNLDGTDVFEFSRPNTTHSDEILLAWTNSSMADAPHILRISPKLEDWFIQLDYVIYSHNVPTFRRGAIIGGTVVGALAAAVLLSIGAFWLKRRVRQKRVATRGIPLGDNWVDKPSLRVSRDEEK